MNWSRLHKHLAALHHAEPQKAARCEHGLRLAEEALALLAREGHHFHLAVGAGVSVPAFPRLVFHMDAAPNGRIVYGEAELEELGRGWYDTLNDAQHQRGMEIQLEGRGGVKRPPRVPALGAPPTEEELVEFLRAVENQKQLLIQEFKARRVNGGGDAE